MRKESRSIHVLQSWQLSLGYSTVRLGMYSYPFPEHGSEPPTNNLLSSINATTTRATCACDPCLSYKTHSPIWIGSPYLLSFGQGWCFRAIFENRRVLLVRAWLPSSIEDAGTCIDNHIAVDSVHSQIVSVVTFKIRSLSLICAYVYALPALIEQDLFGLSPMPTHEQAAYSLLQNDALEKSRRDSADLIDDGTLSQSITSDQERSSDAHRPRSRNRLLYGLTTVNIVVLGATLTTLSIYGNISFGINAAIKRTSLYCMSHPNNTFLVSMFSR